MSIVSWLKRERSSARLAFVLQIFSRIATAALSLWWTSALLHAMGNALYGVFISFQALATLGGLGDLGMGAVIGLRVGRDLGEGKISDLQRFLASGRAAFLLLGAAVCLIGLILSPWLPHWLRFDSTVAGVGSLPVLFAFGSFWAGLIVFSSYINNVNYGVGNVVWPVLPALILLQVAMACHWFAARAGLSLTLQYVPYVVNAGLSVLLVWQMVRISHSELGAFFPLRFNREEWKPIFVQSFWAYLWAIGNAVYFATARMVINAGFGPEAVPPYYLNNRLAELAYTFVVIAGFVSLPKLTQWISMPGAEARQKVLNGARRLNQVQALMGIGVAVFYLIGNDLFIRWWVGPKMQVPLLWQFAFALNLVISACGAAVVQLSSRCGPNGMRDSGIVVGSTALVNVVVAFIAMKMHSILGVAVATVIAQSFSAVALGRMVCRYLGLAFTPWLLRNYIIPVLVISAIYAARLVIPATIVGYLGLVFFGTVLIAATALAIGVNRSFIVTEWQAIRSLLKRV